MLAILHRLQKIVKAFKTMEYSGGTIVEKLPVNNKLWLI